MNDRKYRRLSKTKKREEIHVDYMRMLLKGIRILFYLAIMAAIILTDDFTFLKSLTYLGAIVIAYCVVRIVLEKIIVYKMKVIEQINHLILSEFSLKK
jgi:hypothetical protein